MDSMLADDIHRRMQAETTRSAPPPDFPQLPDLPIARYTDPGFYELELTKVFKRSWLFVGHASQWPAVGSYLVPDIPIAPILVVRGRDERIRAFLNACRHRGAPVVRDTAGCAKHLVCQFHSWSYNLDGTLAGVPELRDFVDLDTAARGLVEIPCQAWGDMIFVNLDPGAPALADWLSTIGVVHHDIAAAPGLRRIETMSYEQGCNWKVTVDAFLEDYHVKTVHRETLAGMLDVRRSVVELYPGGHTATFIPYRAAAGERVIWTADLPKMAVHELYDTDLQSFSLFPNLLVGSDDASGFFIAQWWPLSLSTTRMDVTWYGVDWGEHNRPEGWNVKLFGSDVLMKEDLVNVEPIQRSLEAAAHGGNPISYLERRIWHFHATIDKLIGTADIPAHLRVPDALSHLVRHAPAHV
jgi:phenylpropionate dioxygenase-like ring-hydroxylating dioxygenase large terminal subunit